MWDKDDMVRLNAHIDEHDLEEEVYDLPSGEVARVERMHDAGGETWVVYYWGSRQDHDIDQASGADCWPRCTVSIAHETYIEAAEEIVARLSRQQ